MKYFIILFLFAIFILHSICVFGLDKGQQIMRKHDGIPDSVPSGKIKNTSNTEKYLSNVDFKLKADSIWRVPKRGQQTKICLLLEITNLGNSPIRFPVMDKFKLSMLDHSDHELNMEGGQDVVIPGKPISDPIAPGNTFILELPIQLEWGTDDQLWLILNDNLGSIWRIGPLMAGSYLLSMHYENHPENVKEYPDLWFGLANISPFYIKIIY